MRVQCLNKAVAEDAKRVLIRAGYRYTERGPHLGSRQIDLVVTEELDGDTLDELRGLPGVTTIA